MYNTTVWREADLGHVLTDREARRAVARFFTRCGVDEDVAYESIRMYADEGNLRGGVEYLLDHAERTGKTRRKGSDTWYILDGSYAGTYATLSEVCIPTGEVGAFLCRTAVDADGESIGLGSIYVG